MNQEKGKKQSNSLPSLFSLNSMLIFLFHNHPTIHWFLNSEIFIHKFEEFDVDFISVLCFLQLYFLFLEVLSSYIHLYIKVCYMV